MSIWLFGLVWLLIFAPWLLAAEITHHTLILPLLVMFGVLVAAAARLYRPRENYIGVVNLFGRFWRLVNPNEWMILIPLAQRVRREASLGIRVAVADMRDVLTRDNVPVNLSLKVFYQFDLRSVSPELRVNVLCLAEGLIGEIILSSLEDVVRNRAFINTNYADLGSSASRRSLAVQIAAALAKQVQALGICINPDNGVKITNLQPNEQFKTALCSRSAAVAQGNAALERMEPLLKEMSAHYPNVAWEAVGMMLASALTQDGDLPPVMIPPLPYTPGGSENWGYRVTIPEVKGNKG